MAKQTFVTGDVLTAAAMTSLQQTAMGGGSTTAKTGSYTLVAADAGTVVQMNSASATTITVNTALFAAGDSVQIQNIGAGVCTVTAGTATVNTAGSLALSQYEGGQLYFNTTSAALFFDIVQGSPSYTWTSYTPTVNTSGTNYTSASATGSYIVIGKICFMTATITITTFGSATGYTQITLPQTAVSAQTGNVGAAKETALTNAMGSVMQSDSTHVLIHKYEGGTLAATGASIKLSYSYEVA